MVGETATVELDAQYRQLREECGLLDRSARGKLIVEGADAAEYLQGQLTNDVESLAPGEGCYAALLDRKAHVQADMRVLRLAGDRVWLDTEPETAAATRHHLETYKIGRAVEVVDAGAEKTLLSLVGPGCERVCGAPRPPLHASREARVAAIPCLVVGCHEGIDLIAPASERDRLRSAILDAGAGEVEEAAAEILRIEAGRPRYGAEISAETMPAEAGIVETAVSFTKGCYIGQEPVARLHHRGRPNRLLRGLLPSSPVGPGEPLRLGDKEVGRVGSSCVSPALGPIALAVVRREAEPGAEVRVGEDGVTARVVDLPFG